MGRLRYFLCGRDYEILRKHGAPLEKIKMTMSEVEEGNLEVELVSTERDEIGDLTRGFNQMLSRIRQLIQEVYESRIRQNSMR